MKMFRTIGLFASALMLIPCSLFAQVEGLPSSDSSLVTVDSLSNSLLVASEEVYDEDTTVDEPTENYFDLQLHKGSRPYPIPKVSKVNVLSFKRVFRDIDLLDSANAAFYMPGNYMIDVIVKGIKDGKITAYDANEGSDFTKKIDYAVAMYRLVGDSITTEKRDDEGNLIGTVKLANEYEGSKIKGYRIKEDIFYDNNRSRIETRIIGIAPLVAKGAEGDVKLEAFWLYYPEARRVLAATDISLPYIDERSISFDDLLLRRYFRSKIYQEVKPIVTANKSSLESADGSDAEQNQNAESERIEQEIKDYRNKVWKKK